MDTPRTTEAEHGADGWSLWDFFHLPLLLLIQSQSGCGVHTRPRRSGSPDPVGSVAGDGLDAAALLHDHVDVGFHDLCDLSHLHTRKHTV